MPRKAKKEHGTGFAPRGCLMDYAGRMPLPSPLSPLLGLIDIPPLSGASEISPAAAPQSQEAGTGETNTPVVSSEYIQEVTLQSRYVDLFNMVDELYRSGFAPGLERPSLFFSSSPSVRDAQAMKQQIAMMECWLRVSLSVIPSDRQEVFMKQAADVPSRAMLHNWVRNQKLDKGEWWVLDDRLSGLDRAVFKSKFKNGALVLQLALHAAKLLAKAIDTGVSAAFRATQTAFCVAILEEIHDPCGVVNPFYDPAVRPHVQSLLLYESFDLGLQTARALLYPDNSPPAFVFSPPSPEEVERIKTQMAEAVKTPLFKPVVAV